MQRTNTTRCTWPVWTSRRLFDVARPRVIAIGLQEIGWRVVVGGGAMLAAMQQPRRTSNFAECYTGSVVINAMLPRRHCLKSQQKTKSKRKTCLRLGSVEAPTLWLKLVKYLLWSVAGQGNSEVLDNGCAINMIETVSGAATCGPITCGL